MGIFFLTDKGVKAKAELDYLPGLDDKKESVDVWCIASVLSDEDGTHQ